MRRKILMGVLALALPVGVLGVAGSSAVAAKAPPNPTNCTNVGATVDFAAPGLTGSGTPTTSHTAGSTNVVPAGSFSCSPGGSGSIGSDLTIKGGKNLKNTNYNKTTCKSEPSDTTVCDKYVEGSVAEFSSSAGGLKKDLKSITLSVGGSSVTFSTTGANEVVGAPCGSSETGFQINGTVKKGTYDTAKGGASVLACLDHDTGPGTTNNFTRDLGKPGVTIVTASLDPATSKATL